MHGSHGASTAVKYRQNTNKYRALQVSTKTAGVPHSNGTPLSVGRNAREAYPLNKLSINATEFLQYVIQPCHETSPDSILQAPSNA